jgi:hypothetical protein
MPRRLKGIAKAMIEKDDASDTGEVVPLTTDQHQFFGAALPR